MTTNRFNKIAACAAISCFATVSAWADCRKKIEMVPTPAGATRDISGSVDVRAQGTDQKFKVSMDARVPNGTVFVVFANGLAVGSLRIRLGGGELDLNTKDGDQIPEGANPVCSISTVSVETAKGVAVLNGSF